MRPAPVQAGRAPTVRPAPGLPDGPSRDEAVRPESPTRPPVRPGGASRSDGPPRSDGPARSDGTARSGVAPPVAGPRPDGGPDLPDPAQPSAEPARGARAELRRQLREQRRLKTIALLLASLLVLGALPTYFGVRAATRDPVFNSLDALAVPAWAATDTVDGVSGSRWCFIECRFRERTVESDRAWEETAQVYEAALTREGWRPWKVALCPEQPVEGHYTCWRRDELTLDMWVRKPACPDPVLSVPGAAPSPAATGPGGELRRCARLDQGAQRDRGRSGRPAADH
ncbi:hypothetical protein GCM10027615_66760 [Plantactinospora veratri]